MESKNNKKVQVDDLLIKYIVGSATEEERDISRIWIHENSENKKYFEELKEYYLVTKVIQKPSGFNKEEGWNRIKAGYYKNRFLYNLQDKNRINKKLIIRYAISASAVLIIAFLSGFFISNYLTNKALQNSNLAFNEIIVPLGAKSQVTLSDGTKVWLNAGSKLRYPVTFLKSTREVYLDGEAFFDVTKTNKRLFIVKTSKLNIKVYGTQFNVKSYADENSIQTTLVKGSVAIESIDKSEKQTIFLKPNQSATYYKTLPNKTLSDNLSAKKTSNTIAQSTQNTEDNKISESTKKIVLVPKVDPLPITSWKDTRWVIVGEDLSHLVVKLERRYNVKISFESENLKNYKFSGILAEETFEQVLKIIQISAPIKFSIKSNNVVFSEDPLYKNNYDKMISRTAN